MVAIPSRAIPRAIERALLSEHDHFLFIDNDLDSFESGTSKELGAMRQAVEAIQDQLKWHNRAAFGVMGSLVVASIGLFLNLIK